MASDDPPERAGKARLLSLKDLDQRSRAYTTAVNTQAAIVSDLGGEGQLSTLEGLLARHAALNAAMIEDSYTRWLMGEPVPMAELIPAQNTFLRIAQALGIQRRPKDVTPLDLNSYLEAKNGIKE